MLLARMDQEEFRHKKNKLHDQEPGARFEDVRSHSGTLALRVQRLKMFNIALRD